MKRYLLLLAIGVTSFAWADAPVEDLSASRPEGQIVYHDDDLPVVPVAEKSAGLSDGPVTLAERVARLEQQMKSVTRLQMLQQLRDMRAQLQTLQGQLEVQGHQLHLLSGQLKGFYQDLDRRVTTLKNIVSNGNGQVATKQEAKTAKKAQSKATVPVADVGASDSVVLKENASYHRGVNLMLHKQYGKAMLAFQNYLNTYPNGAYVANTTYWLGEVYFVQKNNAQAEKLFVRVIRQYPKSSKVADASLKLALLHARQGKVKLARQELKQLKKHYAGKTVARLAEIELKRLVASAS